MKILFPENPILTSDELAEITGRDMVSHQKKWLDENGWEYTVSASGKPIVGRMYAHFKVAKIELREAMQLPEKGWKPTFTPKSS